MKLTNRDSEAFRVAGFLATILVVAIHYNTRHFIPPHEALEWNSWFQQFSTNGLARIAVPYFAFSAGLFFFLGQSAQKNYFRILGRRFHTLFVPYVLCIALIIVPEIVYLANFSHSGYDLSIESIFKDTFVDPIAVQFWFLRDLIVLTIASPLIAMVSIRFAAVTLPILLGFWLADFEPFPQVAGEGRPLVSIEVLLFFCVGCYVSVLGADWISKVLQVRKVIITAMVLAVVIAFAIRVQIELSAGTEIGRAQMLITAFLHKSGILLGIYALLLVSRNITSPSILWLSGFNFFVYVFHGLPLIRVITFASDKFVEDQYKFYTNFPVAVLVTFGAAVVFRLLVRPIYDVLVGGR